MDTITADMVNVEIKKQIKKNFRNIDFSGIKNDAVESVEPYVTLCSPFTYDGPKDYPICGKIEFMIKNGDGSLSEMYPLFGTNTVYVCWEGEELEVKIPSRLLVIRR